MWDGASRAMGRSNFAPEKTVDVKFTDDYGISEGAVDNGGPTREFFPTVFTWSQGQDFHLWVST